MSHTWKMILGCVLPFALICVMPLFGVSEGITLLALFVLMFGCHLFMMREHGAHSDAPDRDTSSRGGRGHAQTC